MCKIFKSFFVYYLVLKATLVVAITPEETYKALKDFEAEFWLKWLIPHHDLCCRNKTITQFVSEYLTPLQQKDTFKIANVATEGEKFQPLNFHNLNKNLDFSEANMGEVIFNFYRILQCKVDNRDEEYKTDFIGNIFSIKTTVLENSIDPYFTEISVCKQIYHFCLNYNGTGEQPGNSCLRQAEESPQPWSCTGIYNSTLNDAEHYVLQNLLLCLEVARRRVVDSNIPYGFEDKFCDLPILGAIIIGLELMNDQIIGTDDFFAGQYRCFSGDKRDMNIENLLLIFCQYKNIQTLEQFLKTTRTLYEQFINQKITERILDLGTDEAPNLKVFEPVKKRKRIEVSDGFSVIRNLMEMEEFHIVDVNPNNYGFFYAILQSLKPDVRYIDVKLGDRNWEEAETLKKRLAQSPNKMEGARFLFTRRNWDFLEKELGCKIIVLDAVANTNCIFSSDYIVYYKGCRFIREVPCYSSYERTIILLWRGNRWQAVLPNFSPEY